MASRRPIARTDVGETVSWRIYWFSKLAVVVATLVLVILLYLLGCRLRDSTGTLNSQVNALNITCPVPCAESCPDANATCGAICPEVNITCAAPCMDPCPNATVNCAESCPAIPDLCPNVNVTCPDIPQPLVEDAACDDWNVCTKNLRTPTNGCENIRLPAGTPCFHTCFANGSTPVCDQQANCRGEGCLGNCNNTQGGGGPVTAEGCPIAIFDNSSAFIANEATVCSVQNVCRYYALLDIFSVGYTITDECPDSPEAEELCDSILDPATWFKDCLHGQHTCLPSEPLVGEGGIPPGQILHCRWIWNCAVPRLGFLAPSPPP